MKRGFTLIELLVYMGILGFIVVVAGRVFSDSTVMRVRSQNMLKSAEVIGSVSKLLKDDISQMGVKAWGQNSAGSYMVNVSDKVYWNATSGDYSSYALFRDVPSENFDSLTFRKAEFNNAGVFLGVREVAYWVKGDSLYRSCVTIHGTADGVCPESSMKNLIATNVKKFVFTPSKPGAKSGILIKDTLFPSVATASNYTFAGRNEGDNYVKASTYATKTGDEIVVSGFSARNDINGQNYNQIYMVPEQGIPWKHCIGMDFNKDDTYVVEFMMPFRLEDLSDTNSTQLLPGKDHIAVGIRDRNGLLPPGAPPEVLFYPPQSGFAASVKRHAEFAISKDIDDACIALTFAFYSPKASRGKLRFRNFIVYRKADESFHFPKNVADYGPKEKVKAFELAMEIEFNGEKTNTYSKDDEGNIKGMVITTPNNGIIAQPSSGGTP
ncbi:MAG: type II secretion system GspH family protein [Fibromonadales bacterium]|nr:type II secretion system GspH family protein [Fibromonadales bacterium]